MATSNYILKLLSEINTRHWVGLKETFDAAALKRFLDDDCFARLHRQALDVPLLRDLLQRLGHRPHEVGHRAVRAAGSRVVEEFADALKKIGKNIFY